MSQTHGCRRSPQARTHYEAQLLQSRPAAASSVQLTPTGEAQRILADAGRSCSRADKLIVAEPGPRREAHLLQSRPAAASSVQLTPTGEAQRILADAVRSCSRADKLIVAEPGPRREAHLLQSR